MDYKDMKSEKVKILVAGYEHQCKNYVDALEHAGALPVVGLQLEPPSMADMRADSLVGMQRYSLDDYDGLLLPGGGDMNPILFGQADAGSSDIDDFLDARQMELLREFVEAGKPVLGICRGLQVINVYFGGDLIQDIGKLATFHSGDGCDSVHETVALEDSWLARFYGTHFKTNSRHHQALGQMGEGLVPVQFAHDNIVEGFVHETLPVIGVQWHPERMSYGFLRSDTVDGAAVFLYFISMCRSGRI